MEYSEQPNIILKDPLSPISRKTRRNLLVSSVIAIFIVYTGLIPTKISTLGVEFSNADQSSLLIVLGFIVIYFIIAFYLSGIADYRIWKQLSIKKNHYLKTKGRIGEIEELLIYENEMDAEDKFKLVKEKGNLKKYLPQYRKDRIIGFIRSLGFEVILPFIIGTVAVVSIIIKIISINPLK